MTVPAKLTFNYSEFGEKLFRQAFAAKKPIAGGMELTHRCNLRCVHCYVASDKYPPELTTGQWFQLIDEVADQGCLWWYITGGEAMIRPDFLDIYLHCKRRGMIISLLTNATCISEKIADTLGEYPPHVVEISMYGATPETFDRVGKVKFGYPRFLKGIERLMVRRIAFNLKTMVLRENMAEVHRIRQFAQSLGVSFRYDAVVNSRIDYAQSPHQHAITPREVVDLELQDPNKARQMQQFCENHMGTAQNDNLYQCGAGRSTFNIDPYGRLSVCLLSRRPNYPLLQGSFEEAWDQVQTEINKKRQKDIPCTSCNLRQLCGNCAGSSELKYYEQEAHDPDLCELADLRAEAFGITDGRTRQELYEKENLS